MATDAEQRPRSTPGRTSEEDANVIEEGYIPLEGLVLPPRTLHALLRAGIMSLEELQVLGIEELQLIRNIGPKAIDDIRRVVIDLQDRSGNGLPDHVRLSRLDLSARTCRALSELGVLTVGDVRRLGKDALLTHPHLDPTSVEKLLRILELIPREGASELSVSTTISELELPSDLKRCLYQLGASTLADILSPSQMIQGGLHDLRPQHLARLNNLRHQWNAQTEMRSEKLARSFGIKSLPRVLSWIDLLDSGYGWDVVSSLDRGLEHSGLQALLPLPETTLIGTSTVRYLLQIGCPLSQISAQRIAIDVARKRTLVAGELRSILRLFLTNPYQLRQFIDDYASFESDVMFYAEWLGNQSDWNQEVHATGPSPIARLHLHNSRLDSFVQSLMEGIPTRDQEIIAMRLGLPKGKGRTLQGIAEQHGLTRERVRQLCSKHLKQIRRRASSDERLQALLHFCQEMVDQHGVIRLDTLLIEISDQLCMDISDCSWVIPLLLSECDRTHYSKTLGLLVSHKIAHDSIEGLMASMKATLKAEKAPLRLDDFLQRTAVQNQLAAIPFPHERLLTTCLEASSDFVEVEDGYWALASWDGKLVDDIVMVLRKLGHPAHFREITELVNVRLGNERLVNSGSIHAQLSRYQKLFTRIGPGQFGLREWDTSLPLQPPKYVELIEGVLEEQGKPLTIDEIYSAVNAKRPAKTASISMYLQLDSRFCLLEGRRYGLRKWHNVHRNNAEEESAELEGGIQLPAEFLEQLKHRALQSLMSEQDSASPKGQA